MASAREPEDDILGQRLLDRFEVRKVIGAGAHGVVYEAFDEERGQLVALKSLLRLGAEELYRFKHEFRSLTDISHPNLVTLHELFVTEDAAFFTMELVRGTDFLSHVHLDEGGFDEERLRAALAQLATGLAALHRFGRLHRDLKPSNVLVRTDGQVLIGDFGLVRELASGKGESGLVGSPAYMSPEQAAAMDLTLASDWYSVGVILHEALADEGPFASLRGMALLMAKQVGVAELPSRRVAGVPPDLDRLCVDLLARDPPLRPSAEEVLRALGCTPPPEDIAHDDLLVGRELELAALEDALSRTHDGGAVVVFAHGESGAGKTALLRRFAADARDGGAVVLAGRCYERDSVPYKGLDVLVDALRTHLRRLAPGETAQLFLPNAGALARLFPVLEDAPGFATAAADVAEDLLELRRQGTTVLRDTLAVLAGLHPTIILLDDVQWCDHDSAGLLSELLRPADRPPVLVVLSYRSDSTSHEVVQGLRASLAPSRPEVDVVELAVTPLGEEDAHALATSLLRDDPERESRAIAITRESQGNPLFITELSQHASSEARAGEPLGLAEVIRARADNLPAQARRMLEVIAVAGRPVEQGLAFRAGDFGDQGEKWLALLRAQSFIRSRGAGMGDHVECYHSRVALAVLDGLDHAQLVRTHGQLADQLESRGGEPELIAFHLDAAGRTEEAAGYTARAAAVAARALAFNRAVRLFGLALELLPPNHAGRFPLQVGLADALAHDGRGAAAARAYLAAASNAEQADVLELRRRGAEQLLRSGRYAEGVAQLRGVLDAVGIRAPSTPLRSAVSFLWQRARIRLRGAEFEERAEADVPPDLLLRVDTCWAAATGLLQTNVLMGQDFQSRHLLLALRAGEPHRVARALGMETLYSATSGEGAARETEALLERVETLSRRLDDPHALGVAELAAGVFFAYRGRFLDALPRLEQAEEILRERCTNVAWELGMVRVFTLLTLYYLGDFAKMTRTLEHARRDAIARDDFYTTLMLSLVFAPMAALAEDRLADARAELAMCRQRWPTECETSTFRYVMLLTESRVERYEGAGVASYRGFEDHWGSLVRSLMLTKEPFRVFMKHERGCSAMMAAYEDPERRAELVRVGDRDAQMLAKEQAAWGRALARPIAASVRAARGDRDGARRELETAVEEFESSGMHLYAAAMHRRLGELVEGPEGHAAIVEAERSMHERAVAWPEGIASMFAPPVVGWETG